MAFSPSLIAQRRAMSPPVNGNGVSSKSASRSSMSPPHQRPLGRASTLAETLHPLRHRRSSNLSESIDSTRQSIKSTTDDLLLPRAGGLEALSGHEPSHWHSVPLALALLPALGGLFFQNGSGIVTDMTLLILAAIFLNWAVRLPWDWYISAQAIQAEDPRSFSDEYPTDTIIEEGSEDEETEHPPNKPQTKDSPQKPAAQSLSQASALSELRIFELLALAACFVSPVIGAWLLHHIRGQLSRPSEGLVSNYNLTIFLLASELRPMSHLIKLVQARTLYLQRVVATNPHSQSSNISPSALEDLQTRLTELESHVVETTSNGSSKAPPPDLTTNVRKAMQPDLDALNRAVRRYEKRTTLLSLQTESRLQDLEKRLGDAITLAAAAERSSQSSYQRRGSGFGLMIDWLATIAYLPFQIAWTLISFPSNVIAGIIRQVEGYVGQKIRREMRTAGRGDTKSGSGSEKRRAQGKPSKKAF